VGSPPLGLSRFVLAPAAWRDLESIWQYIAADSVRNADAVERAVFAACSAAAQTPGLGHSRPDLRVPDILFLPLSGYENYSIAYLAGSIPLRIVRVVHGARDVPGLFR
jgi:plasmid stabilization system protein ParE